MRKITREADGQTRVSRIVDGERHLAQTCALSKRCIKDLSRSHLGKVTGSWAACISVRGDIWCFESCHTERSRVFLFEQDVYARIAPSNIMSKHEAYLRSDDTKQFHQKSVSICDSDYKKASVFRALTRSRLLLSRMHTDEKTSTTKRIKYFLAYFHEIKPFLEFLKIEPLFFTVFSRLRTKAAKEMGDSELIFLFCFTFHFLCAPRLTTCWPLAPIWSASSSSVANA